METRSLPNSCAYSSNSCKSSRRRRSCWSICRRTSSSKFLSIILLLLPLSIYYVKIPKSTCCLLHPHDVPRSGSLRDTGTLAQGLPKTTLSWNGYVGTHHVYPSSLTSSCVGGYSLTHMDEFVDQLLTDERVCDLILPRLTKRDVLEELGDIGPRKSRLLDAMEGKSEHGSERSRSRSSDRSGRERSGSPASRSPSRGRSASRENRSPSPAGSRYISRSRSGSRSPYRSRSRSISPDRVNGSPASDRFRSRSRSISPDRMDTT